MALRARRFQFGVAQADGRPALPDGDGRGDCAFVAHRLLGGAGRFEVERPRQAVRDQRRFQGDEAWFRRRASLISGARWRGNDGMEDFLRREGRLRPV